MAKIKFGMMMTDARGKLGGQVFSKNRNGAYVRTKVTPTNPRTAEQQAGRSLLGALSQQWSALTESARASFNEAVTDWSRTNIFGDTMNPTGKNLFVQLNKNAQAVGFSSVDVAPAKVEMNLVTGFAVEIDLANNVITASGTGALTDAKVVIRATPPLTQGTSFVKGKFRDIAVGENAYPTAVVLNGAYTDRFGAIPNGANIVFELLLVKANGQKSVPVQAKATFA
jgi:hypothetical protein